jgi:ubiquitin-like modifier-activating enzyme ATG7
MSQCTGMSLISPYRINAPADLAPGPNESSKEEPGSPLGLVPHQLRGQLGEWRTMLIEGAAYDRCTGCSQIVRPLSRIDTAARSPNRANMGVR